MSVKDQEGIGLKTGDLVFYSGEVWKISSIVLPDEKLMLRNMNGIRNGVSARNVEALGRDTISGLLGSNGAHGHPMLRFKVGDHVCTKSGKFRTGKVTAITTDKVTFEVWEDGTCKEVIYKANAVELTKSLALGSDPRQRESTTFSFGEIDERERNWQEEQWWERYSGGSSGQRAVREPEKKDSISMGELIEEEAKRLSREGRPPKEASEEEDKKPKIKKRQGEW